VPGVIEIIFPPRNSGYPQDGATQMKYACNSLVLRRGQIPAAIRKSTIYISSLASVVSALGQSRLISCNASHMQALGSVTLCVCLACLGRRRLSKFMRLRLLERYGDQAHMCLTRLWDFTFLLFHFSESDQIADRVLS